MRRLLALSLGFGLLAGCDAPVPAGQRAGLAGGEPASDPAVVVVSGSDGTFCTGTAIADRVVLSAKHCVQQPSAEAPRDPSTFTIGVGDDFSALSSAHRVLEVFVPPGIYTAGGPTGIGVGIEGDDVALLVAADSLGVTPSAVRLGAPSELGGTTARAVGFGFTPTGTSGAKLSVDTTVAEVRERTLVTEPATCAGDSGGPLFDGAGEVVGVSSFVLGACGLGTSHFNRLDVHADLIASALAAADACTATGPELCNARDDDCNGMVDEGCTPLGAPCSFADECVGGGICAETAMGFVCSIRCDPRRPALGCGPGLYCDRNILCEGFCVSGTAGSGADGDACAADTDCASLNCVDPGDGRARCAAPCESDTGTCAGGLFCAAEPRWCGGCVADGWSGQRGIGEPCAEDGECLSLYCGTDGGARYCSRYCDGGDDICGAGFHCRDGSCVLGARGAGGAECLVDADCREGLRCVSVDGVGVCAAACETDADCGAGFVCGDAEEGRACLPELALLGEPCSTGADCVSSLCAATDEGMVCTRQCSPVAACPITYQCVAPDDGSASVCVRLPEGPPPGEDDGGGDGGCASVTPSSSPWAAILLSSVVLLGRRRRR